MMCAASLNSSTLTVQIETRYEEKVAHLEEQLRQAEDARIAHTLHAPTAATNLPVLPVVVEQQPTLLVPSTHFQRIAAVEARFKERKEEILRSLQAANATVNAP